MATLQADTHVGRIEAGDALLAAAETVDVKVLAKKFTTFRACHKALVEATEALSTAEARFASAQHAVAEADVTQDATVDSLASALVGIGQPRTRPFAGLCTHAPSALKVIGYEAEAKEIKKLVGKVRKREHLTAPVTAACKDAERAASAVLVRRVPSEKARARCMRSRQSRRVAANMTPRIDVSIVPSQPFRDHPW